MLSLCQLNSIGHGRLYYCGVHFSIRCIRSVVWYVSFRSTIGTVRTVLRVRRFKIFTPTANTIFGANGKSHENPIKARANFSRQYIST